MELLVFVQDKVHADFYMDTKMPKRGDVISVAENGHQWGLQELAHPMFRVVVVPDLDQDEAEMLLAPEVNQDVKNPSKTLQYRAFKLDLDHELVAEHAEFWNDHTVIDVVAKHGDLVSIAILQTVPAIREDVTLRKNAQGAVTGIDVIKVDVSYEKTLYRPADLEQAEALKDTQVSFVGPTIRAKAVLKLPADTILKIKTEKKPIQDPRIFGSARVDF